MALLTRLILALTLVVQSLPGIAVERCAEMTRATRIASAQSDMGDEVPCACCSGKASEKSAPACPKSDATTACKCGMPQPEQPKAPPSDSKTEQVQFAVAVLPAFLGFLFEPVDQPTPHVSWLGASPKRPGNSIQSVLCVWVV
jgi:hypothetical protein